MCKASRRARSATWSRMGMSGISKSQVRHLCEEIDGKVKAFSIARSKATGPTCGSTRPI